MSGVSLSLENKVALITGGSRGIGAAAVRLFRQAGATVAFNYRSAQAAAEALAADCGGPAHCAAFAQDLASPEDGRTLVRRTVETFGRLDILVVNHGVWPPEDAPIATLPESQWRSTLAINLDSVYGLLQAAVGAMQQQTSSRTQPRGERHIVLVSSTAGQRGEAFHADYAASKGALISMTKGLATELAPSGIRVNCVAPGWVATDMSAPALADPPTRDRIFGAIPLARVADPNEIAGPILFLCTPLAGFMTGEIVNVNGGAVLVG
ncbi:MAG TPA: SDR family oxidoreductase [Acidobacteriaceae bacterium]|jgi:3-oxoacyl-[acyl-carrier protein] reductase|nr:SDR family oxidoreductase [Acidobacteriaceae bacterium]